jgi:PBP1b-binding outer membrane lipoprotein LpoB
MTVIKPLLALLIVASLLFGCSNDTNDNESLTKEKETQPDTVNNQTDFELIASEKTLPANFYDIAFERETTPIFQYLFRKAVNQSEFEQTWNLYGIEKKIPNVDFNEKDVFFIGVHESGSCPYKIKDVEFSSDNTTMRVPLAEPEGACTSDATPRTFVIQIDKEISTEIENAVIVQSGVETNVPFEN